MARLREGRMIRTCGLGHFIPAYIRLAADAGFDCIWLDLEHRRMTRQEVQTLLVLCHQFDIDCLLRAPTLDRAELYGYLEDGASGLMIPHVSTPEKAQMLVDAVKFPPLGDRGLDGAGFDSDYFLQGGEDYPQQANDETMLVIQIETPQAVANVDAIAAIPGVDGMFVGPGDLGLRLRQPGQEMTLDDAFQKVADAAARHGKAWGCPVATPEAMQQRYDQGARLLAHGGDFFAMMQMLRNSIKAFDQVES